MHLSHPAMASGRPACPVPRENSNEDQDAGEAAKNSTDDGASIIRNGRALDDGDHARGRRILVVRCEEARRAGGIVQTSRGGTVDCAHVSKYELRGRLHPGHSVVRLAWGANPMRWLT